MYVHFIGKLWCFLFLVRGWRDVNEDKAPVYLPLFLSMKSIKYKTINNLSPSPYTMTPASTCTYGDSSSPGPTSHCKYGDYRFLFRLSWVGSWRGRERVAHRTVLLPSSVVTFLTFVVQPRIWQCLYSLLKQNSQSTSLNFA